MGNAPYLCSLITAYSPAGNNQGQANRAHIASRCLPSGYILPHRMSQRLSYMHEYLMEGTLTSQKHTKNKALLLDITCN